MTSTNFCNFRPSPSLTLITQPVGTIACLLDNPPPPLSADVLCACPLIDDMNDLMALFKFSSVTLAKGQPTPKPFLSANLALAAWSPNTETITTGLR